MKMWNSTLLKVLWTFQLTLIIYQTVNTVPWLFSHFSYYHYRYYISYLIRPILTLLLLLLTSIEIHLFKYSQLLPPFFTISQATGVVAIFYQLWPVSDLHRRPFIRTSSTVTLWLTFVIGTIYGIYLWIHWWILGYPELSSSTQQECSLNMPNNLNRSDQIRTDSSKVALLVNWIYEPVLYGGGGRLTKPSLKALNCVFVGLKYIPGLVAMIFLIPFCERLAGEPLRQGVVENLKFQNWNYLRPDLKVRHNDISQSSNEDVATDEAISNPPQTDTLSLHTLVDDLSSVPPARQQDTLTHSNTHPERLLGPRYLCYLDAEQPKGYKTFSTRDYSIANNTDGVTDYVFISYTRRQFYTRITGDPTLPTEQNQALQAAAERDTSVLIEYAIHAAKAAKAGAFWIDYECCQPEDTENWNDSVEDVYRICDIVRAAHSLVIVVGPPLNDAYQHDQDQDHTTKARWLHDWGRRLWTVPEALLTPSEHRISVYTAGIQTPEVIAKRNLASRVWDDAGTLRQLVDHYEASLPLTQLELISIALACLQRRQTEKRMNGDVAYALMGLLRQRPKVVKTDSDFQAFARLSLANDSDMLLERMICLKPQTTNAAWHDLGDAWEARLWDIYPICQVAGVVDEDKIMLGGAQGAMINWNHLHTVDYRSPQVRATAWLFARLSPTTLFSFLAAWWITFAVYDAVGAGARAEDVKAVFTLIYGPICAVVLCLMFGVPPLLRSLYSREISDSQARLFGIEGQPDLEVVERHIFGWSNSRLKWVSSANPDQSSGGISEALPLRGDDIRQFTLIDTFTCSAMLFEARVPPNIAIACGREHGFLRTVLCSYNHQTKTLYKEAVVRMSTTVLDRMPNLDIFRFTMNERQEAIDENER